MRTLQFQVPAVRGGHVGANVALVHRRELDRELGAHEPSEPAIVIVDFSVVTSATASYLKTVWLSLVLTGAEAFRGGTKALVDGPPIRDLYPVVTNLNDEVRHELELIATAERLVAIEALKVRSATLRAARVLGPTDPAVRETIAALLRHGRPASASELHAAGASRIAVTAWNNRLNELCRLRVAIRSKEGRQMFYQLVAPEVSIG